MLDRLFLKHVEKTENCWNWIGSISTEGYGNLGRNINGKGVNYKAHRYAYQNSVGPIPDGMCLDHICRNRRCVNPAHLRVVTRRENAIQNSLGRTAVNAKKTHCPKGHPYDGVYTWPSKKGNRYCLLCRRANNRKWDTKERARERMRRWRARQHQETITS